jgi:hypothetical protein
LLFLLVQGIDGALTYFGILTFGLEAEGNPFVASLISFLGHGPGLLSAKLFACIMGTLLYAASAHRILVALVCLHLVAAIVPWAAHF